MFKDYKDIVFDCMPREDDPLGIRCYFVIDGRKYMIKDVDMIEWYKEYKKVIDLGNDIIGKAKRK